MTFFAEDTHEWHKLSRVVKEEGNELWEAGETTEDECKKLCDQSKQCKSFTFCNGNQCFLKDKHLDGTELKKYVPRCNSWYRGKNYKLRFITSFVNDIIIIFSLLAF